MAVQRGEGNSGTLQGLCYCTTKPGYRDYVTAGPLLSLKALVSFVHSLNRVIQLCSRGNPGKEENRSRLGPWTFSPLYIEFHMQHIRKELNVLEIIITNVLPVIG